MAITLLDQNSFELTVLVAVIFAGAARTVIPYLAKRQADISEGKPPRSFSWSYIATALLGIVPIGVGAILLFPALLPQITNTGSQLMVFITAFGLAYATTDIVNRNISTLNLVGVNVAQTPVTTTVAK